MKLRINHTHHGRSRSSVVLVVLSNQPFDDIVRSVLVPGIAASRWTMPFAPLDAWGPVPSSCTAQLVDDSTKGLAKDSFATGAGSVPGCQCLKVFAWSIRVQHKGSDFYFLLLFRV